MCSRPSYRAFHGFILLAHQYLSLQWACCENSIPHSLRNFLGFSPPTIYTRTRSQPVFNLPGPPWES